MNSRPGRLRDAESPEPGTWWCDIPPADTAREPRGDSCSARQRPRLPPLAYLPSCGTCGVATKALLFWDKQLDHLSQALLQGAVATVCVDVVGMRVTPPEWPSQTLHEICNSLPDPPAGGDTLRGLRTHKRPLRKQEVSFYWVQPQN